MFNRRALQIKMVKTTKADKPENETPNPYQDPELMNAIAQDFVKNTVITLGAAFAAKTVLTTVCEIAKIAAQAKL